MADDSQSDPGRRRKRRGGGDPFDLRRRLFDHDEEREEADLELDEAGAPPAEDERRARGILRYIWPKRDLSRGERREVLAQLFPEPGDTAAWVSRHFALMGFSVAIATYGLLNNSSAVVIGAMLVAPLMTPMMGYSAAMVMAWPRRQAWSLTLVALSSTYGIVLAFLFSLVVPSERQLGSLPFEVLSRTSPNALDLLIALAAGAAGAYVTVRSKAGGAALPGVAIAVALVPPLATIGITLENGAWDDAAGAMLLFLTNWAAIALSAAAVFLVSGVTPRARAVRYSRRIKTGVTFAGVVVVAVAIPLGYYSQQQFVSASETVQARNAIEDWIGDRDLRVEDLIVTEKDGIIDVTAVVAGPDQPASTDSLAGSIADELDEKTDVEVRWSEEAVTRADGSP